MAAQKTKQIKINLLPQEEFKHTTAGRILTWFTTSFRMIVIFTELIVMGSFFSRFVLDVKSNDLSDEIEAKAAIVQAYQGVEQNFRTVQKKLDIYSFLISENLRVSPLVKKIVSSVPNDVQIISATFNSSNELFIKAQSFSEQSIGQFIANLNSLPEFPIVTLTEIVQLENNPMITFSIRAAKEKI